MKWFYIISIGAVAAMALSPFVLLPGEMVAGLGNDQGKTVSYGTYASKVRSVDPATAGDTMSASIQGNVYESLYTYHYLLRPPTVVPQLAQDMPDISPDGLVYTFKIKPGVKYHRNPCFGVNPDGSFKTRTVRAEDFVLAFKRIADFHLPTPMSLAFIEDKVKGLTEYSDRTRTYDKGDFRRYDEPFEGVAALDELTFQIRLVVPFPQLIYVLAINNYAPVPREVIDYWLATRDDGHGGREPLPLKERSPQISDFRAAVGSGAYYLSKFVTGGDIVMERNPDFGPSSADPNDSRCFYPREGMPEDAKTGLLADAGKPVPFVDVNRLMYVAEENPAWGLFVGRITDVSAIPNAIYSQVVSPGRQLTDQWAKMGIEMITYTDPAVYWYAFNMDDPVVGKSRSLRQAISLAFDVDKYIDVLFNGRGKRAVNVVPSVFPDSDKLPASPYARFDLQAAREKMVQARKELEEAGVIQPGAALPRLRLDLGGTDEQERRVAEFSKYMFKRIGLELDIELNDWPTLQEKVENKQCQVYAMGWHADYPDPENFLQLYYSPNIKRGTNNTDYSNPAFDRLYEQAARMLPSPQRTQLYARLVEMLNEDCPVMLLTEPVTLALYHDWMHNFKPHPIGYGFYKYRRLDVRQRQRETGR